MKNVERNWAKNYQYTASQFHYPETIAEIQEIVRKATKVKALGSRHSFNNIADCSLDLISFDKLESEMILHPENHQVSVSANVKYGALADFLHQAGYALHNLASLPHISVAGACATATHGSGDKNRNLATAVSAIEFISASGTLQKLSRQEHPEIFPGAIVSLGGLGIITTLTLDIQPTYNIRQIVYENLPFSRLAAQLDDIFSSAYSVSLFTDWSGSYINQVWLKELVAPDATFEPQPTFWGAVAAEVDRHPIITFSAENCTRQLGIPGPWHTRLPHFRMAFTPSSGDELQTEYFVPRLEAYPALLAIAALGPKIAPLLQISEIRTIAADNLWLSPCYHQDSVAIHFTWKPDWQNVKQLLPAIESALEPFGVKPHWAKLFTMDPSTLQSRYQMLPIFRQLLKNYDPTGKFRNEFLNTYVFS